MSEKHDIHFCRMCKGRKEILRKFSQINHSNISQRKTLDYELNGHFSQVSYSEISIIPLSL